MGFEKAGMEIERIAKSYGMSDMREAYRRALRENPNLARTYNNSVEDVPPMTVNKGYAMSASNQAMALAQVDVESNKQRAGAVLGHGAMGLAGSNQRGAPNQVSPERYRAAMNELMNAFPDLGECYNSGVVAPDNWALLATLVPSVAGEIKKRHGVDPYNLRSGRYASSQGVRKYDNAGNEYRTYVR
jgi:hypothetical protein